MKFHIDSRFLVNIANIMELAKNLFNKNVRLKCNFYLHNLYNFIYDMPTRSLVKSFLPLKMF